MNHPVKALMINQVINTQSSPCPEFNLISVASYDTLLILVDGTSSISGYSQYFIRFISSSAVPTILLTLYTLKLVWIFSILFSIHFLRC